MINRTCCHAWIFLVFLTLCGFLHSSAAAVSGRTHRESVKPPSASEGEAVREATGERIRKIEEKRALMSESMREEREKIRELIIRHRRTEKETEKEAIAEELRQLIETSFDKRHSALQERLEALREECHNIENRLKESLAQRDQIISRRVDSLLQPPPRRGDAPEDRGRGIVRERER